MMTFYNRRKFLRTAAALATIAAAGSSFAPTKKMPLLSFSTLGCPDWPFEKIVDFAVTNNFKGLEIRGILRELDLTKCREFNSPDNIAATNKLMAARGLQFVDLGSSSTLHYLHGKTRDENLASAKQFIDLARQLHCPYIRVFPNNLPKEQEKGKTLELIAAGLLELGNYAKGTGVTVLLETHGDLVYTADLLKVMQAATHPNVGLVWDIVNMWSVTKEAPAAVYAALKKYIHHTHIKDLAITADGKERYTLLGKGETPVFDGVNILYNHGFKGFYSFEWEKLWHPEIEAPELAIADYAVTMQKHFKQ